MIRHSFLDQKNRKKKELGGISVALNRFVHHIKQPKYLLSFIAFFNNTILFYFIWLMEKLPFIGIVAPYIVPVFVIVAILFMYKGGYLSRIKGTDFLFIFFVISTVILSMLIYPNTYDVMKTRYIPIVFNTCIPYYLLGVIFDDNDETLDFLGVIAHFAIIIGVIYIYYMLNFGNQEAINEDNMSLAYNYLTVEMLSVIYAFRRKKIISIIISIVGAILIVSLGTRGPVVLLFVFLTLCILKTWFDDKRKRIPLIASSVILISVIIGQYKNIVLFLQKFFRQVGLSTRVLEKVLQQNLLEDTDRSIIASTLISRINERPLLGYGVAGEWQFVNWNAHNLYLSFLCNFGMILGVGLVLALLIISCRALFKNKNSNSQYILLMFICLVFVQGFFSGEPLSMEVFFLCGFGVNQIRKKQLNNYRHKNPPS